MLRNVGLRAAAAAAAAGAPSTSHCHAQAPRLKKLHKADSGEGVQLKEYNGGHENMDWLVADMVAGNIVFGKAELADATGDVMTLMNPKSARVADLVVEEVTGDSDSSTDDSHHANDLIAEAEHRLRTRSDVLSAEFQASLECMLNDPAVQIACTRALIQNHHFSRLVESSEGELSQDQLSTLLPAAAAAAHAAPDEEGSGKPMEALVAALARGLVRLGELVAPARDAVARALIGIGYKIHTLLGRPFKEETRAAGADFSKGDAARAADWWANVLITVGCAVIALLLLKRGTVPLRAAAGVSVGAGVSANGARAMARARGGGAPHGAPSHSSETAIA